MGPIVNANYKVTPGTAFDNKTNDSLYQYHYTPSSTKEILTWTKAKIYLPSPSRRSPYSIFTHASDLLLYFFFLCLMFGFLHLIWFIETRGDGFSTRGEPVCLFYYFFFFFFFSLFDVWIFASDLFHFGARGDEFSTRGDEVYIFYIWVFRPMLTSKIKQPTSQTEQYPQATTFPWFIYPYPWALLSFSKLLLNLFKFYKKELLIFALK